MKLPNEEHTLTFLGNFLRADEVHENEDPEEFLLKSGPDFDEDEWQEWFRAREEEDNVKKRAHGPVPKPRMISRKLAAEYLKPPTTWRKPNITLSSGDLTTTAAKALKKAIQRLNWTDGQLLDGTYADTGLLYAQMIELDKLTEQKNYEDNLMHYFNASLAKKPGFLDKQNYGYAAALAYNTYGNQDFLIFADASWESAKRYTISKKQADTGTIEAKKFTLSLQCDAENLAGGTYLNIDPNNPVLDGLASGMFLVVSALLANATSKKKYIHAANESAHFIQSHLLDSSDHIVRSGINSNSDESSGCSLIPTISPCGSGAFIEGLAILAASGTREYATTEALLNSTVFAATNDSLLHQGVDGVYIYHQDDEEDGGHYIVRALASLYEHKNASSDLREYSKAYIGVQYNAIMDMATANSSDIYRLPWTGPPNNTFDSNMQTSALTVLIGAIPLVNGQSSPNTDSNLTSSAGTSLPPQPPSKSSDIPSSSVTASSSQTTSITPAKKQFAGVIAGSVVGGITFLAAVTVGAIFLCKLRLRRNDGRLGVGGSSSTMTPFLFTGCAASSENSGEQHQRNRVKSGRLSRVAMGEEPSTRATDNGLVGISGMDALTEPTASPRTVVASPESPPPDDGRQRILMEELLRSLNVRLSQDRWNEESEEPPVYHEGYAM
ncbi:hypothetical protein EDD18DRAFT_1467728 [Armillaria luteobubalina]|uniref:Glycoside hydrolase family 76 protein n=1 Tax=Armillaria luteobubalina TaxID=153913 RepID=A0AA39PFW7_9AGAR|nr:hypothetical protein EDD18DRAFT_1467728 [Armillaria luteobubalina]